MEISKKTYSEVYAIINLMSLSLIDKIPSNILEKIEKNCDTELNIEINNIEQYKPSEEASKLLAILYKNYFSTEEEKKVILAKEKSLYEKEQKELYEKYNPNNIFETNNPSEVQQELMLVNTKETFFRKIMNKIRNVFKRDIV